MTPPTPRHVLSGSTLTLSYGSRASPSIAYTRQVLRALASWCWLTGPRRR